MFMGTPSDFLRSVVLAPLTIALVTSCANREELPPDQWKVAPRDVAAEYCDVPAINGLRSGEEILVSFLVTA